MSKGYICDRCNSVIPDYNVSKHHFFLYNIINLPDKDKPYFEIEGNPHYCELDFCDECLRELSFFTNAFLYPLEKN